MSLIIQLNEIFWGWLLATILLGAGLYFTIRLRAPQIRYFPKLFANARNSMKNNDGVSGFGALCATLGGQVGTGNLVGVATALVSGGPGAIFWMWITALVGMATNFLETVLALVFREETEEGVYAGGPAYYIQKGMKNKFLAGFFSISIIVGIGFVFAMLQSNSVAAAVAGVSSVPPLVSGIILLIITALVIFGGVKRISNFATIVVPIMALAYLAIAVVVIILRITELPAVLSLVLRSAFDFESKAVVGGVVGYSIRSAFRYGVARGLFSNDAGNGTTPCIHASANVKHPATQGLSAMLGVFVDTIVICTCTASLILFSGTLDSGLTGIELTQAALGNLIGPTGPWIIFVAMLLFGYTTLLADIFYGESNVMWFFPNNKKMVTLYRLVACGLIIVGALLPVSDLWELVDFFCAFMVFSNVIGLVFLTKHGVHVLQDYEKKKNAGVSEPEWDFQGYIAENNLDSHI